MRILAITALLVAFASVASAAPMGATVIYQEGVASVFSTTVGKRLPLHVGDRVAEGDRIRTGRDGNVEIEFDTGSVIKIDADTDLVVKSLRRDDKGSTFSIFGLLFGRVKSAVKKLVGAESKFEYHTKAVVAGVAGTPPWVITVPRAPGGPVEIDLLGARGSEGSVFVQGLDPQKTLINLSPGAGTRILPGKPPAPPTPISPARFRQLNQGMPFVALPRLNAAAEGKMSTEEALSGPGGEKQKEEETKEEGKEGEGAPPAEEKEPEKEKPEEKPKETPDQSGDSGAPDGDAPDSPAASSGGAAQEMTVNGIQRIISTPVLTAPDKVNTTSAVENKGTSSQGTVGQDAAASGADTPPTQTKTIKIRIDLK